MLKLVGYIEAASADKVHAQWQADAANFQGIIGERDNYIREQEDNIQENKDNIHGKELEIQEKEHLTEGRNESISQLARELDDTRNQDPILVEEAINSVRASASYRLGYALIQPLRWLGLRRGKKQL